MGQTYRSGSIILSCCCSGYNRVLWPSPSPCPSLRISKQSHQTHQPGGSFPSWPGPTCSPLSEQNFISSAGPRLILSVFRFTQSSDPSTLRVCLKLPQLLLQPGDRGVLTHARRTETSSVSPCTIALFLPEPVLIVGSLACTGEVTWRVGPFVRLFLQSQAGTLCVLIADMLATRMAHLLPHTMKGA